MRPKPSGSIQPQPIQATLVVGFKGDVPTGNYDKREKGFRYFHPEDLTKSAVAIIYFYLGPDGSEQQNVRLLVIDGTTFILEAVELPRV